MPMSHMFIMQFGQEKYDELRTWYRIGNLFSRIKLKGGHMSHLVMFWKVMAIWSFETLVGPKLKNNEF
jgi:hypothetical protein